MLSGLKFIPRNELDKGEEEDLEKSRRERKKSRSRKSKNRRQKRSSRDSSSEDDLERIKKRSRKKQKWYSSEEDLSSGSDDGSDSENTSDYDGRKRKSKKTKEAKRRRKESLSDDSCGSESEDERHDKESKIRGKKDKKRASDDELDGGGEGSWKFEDISRKEMGLEWMLQPKRNKEQTPAPASVNPPEEVQAAAEEIKKVNPRELNPYLKNNGTGYPEDSDGRNGGSNQLLSSSIVGDGGASWRLKALKRAQEQAAREGRKLDEVVEDRWGSLGQLAVSAASCKAAPIHAHLHAIKSRRRGSKEEEETETDKQNQRGTDKDDSSRYGKMRVPKLQGSLSWGKRRMPTEDVNLSAAISSINKFADDGNFMRKFIQKKNDDSTDPLNSSNPQTERGKSRWVEESHEDVGNMKPALTANHLAAKVLQLRMKGKHEEAEKLLREAPSTEVKPGALDESSKPRIDGSTSRYIMHEISARQKEKEEDADLNLAQTIMKNQKYSIASQADDEYDYDDGPRRKARKKGGGSDHKSSEISRHANRMLTQKDRCQFCFENPARPKHLVVAIGNFTYLSLPHWEPVVPGHCCILTMQHESSTRIIDNNVWDEIRNFKKCLIMMFAKQEKDLVFLETVMGLAQQRRHCLVECIPLPPEVAKQAPLYFKKAIDEAEEEWSQHNAKKLIDTSEKGLRASIPKNFPYFHVEFGLNKGFVHVIDDEKEFKSNFGLNVLRGMLRLPAEDMHRRRKYESVETQRQAVTRFAQDWEPFDWTKQLG